LRRGTTIQLVKTISDRTVTFLNGSATNSEIQRKTGQSEEGGKRRKSIPEGGSSSSSVAGKGKRFCKGGKEVEDLFGEKGEGKGNPVGGYEGGKGGRSPRN